MKYVDVELLTKEIDSLYDKWCGSSTGLEAAEEGASIGTAESIFEEIHKIIDSLQQEQPEVFDTIAFQKGVKEGKRLMMEGAVEADVNTYRNLEEGTSWAEFVVEMPTNNLGDKVRIIILPKEDAE